MNSREAVLANIRRSLGVRGDEAPRKLEIETRLVQLRVTVESSVVQVCSTMLAWVN